MFQDCRKDYISQHKNIEKLKIIVLTQIFKGAIIGSYEMVLNASDQWLLNQYDMTIGVYLIVTISQLEIIWKTHIVIRYKVY